MVFSLSRSPTRRHGNSLVWEFKNAPAAIFIDNHLTRPSGCCRYPTEIPKDPAMQEHDLAIPILPCRSVESTKAFYGQFGFDGKIWGAPHFYATLRRDTVEIHFFTHADLDPAESSAGCYIRVQNVDCIYQTFAKANLPKAGIPRMDDLENKPWGMREFAIVDPDGNLIRIGQTI